MKHRYFFTSLRCISDLPEVSFSVEVLSKREWETGDYVVGEVTSPPNRLSRIELTSGRMVEVVEGDLIVGAFGVRYATLESVGGWQGIGRDRMMEALTGAELFGKEPSGNPTHRRRTRERAWLHSPRMTPPSRSVPTATAASVRATVASGPAVPVFRLLSGHFL